MPTPKKPTSNTKKDNTMNTQPKSFSFNDFNKYKDMYKNILHIKHLLEVTKNKFPDTPDCANACNNACSYLLTVLQTILNRSNNTNDHKTIQSLYGYIYKKLMDTITNLNNDYENRAAILKVKLEDLESQRKTYVESELKGIEDSNNEFPDWKHIEDKEILNIIGKLLGVKKDPSSNRRMIIDENGIWFE